jgi:hypothetical protein
MIFLVALVLLVGLVASLTKLAWDDEITAPVRVLLREKRGDGDFWVRALECPRCTSVWISLATTFLALISFGIFLNLTGLAWLGLALAWIPAAMSIAYLAFVLIIRGEA